MLRSSLIIMHKKNTEGREIQVDDEKNDDLVRPITFWRALYTTSVLSVLYATPLIAWELSLMRAVNYFVKKEADAESEFF